MNDPSYFENMGESWMNSNKEFDRTNPNIGQRVVRTLNPLTSFGSGIGMMHEAASNGDATGMGLAALSSMPIFGSVRALKVVDPKTFRHIPTHAFEWDKLIKAMTLSAGIGLAADGYEIKQKDLPSPKEK